MSPVELRYARVPEDLAVVRTLFREYADALGVDLCFQDFETELATLPGKYAPPSGRIVLAWRGEEAVGCVALRWAGDAVAEMKRLYVRPSARGEHLGRRLAQRICDEARAAGYARICLDTLPTMKEAISLYRSLGFGPTQAYVYNPIPGTLYLARDL